jgi:hypothetical protein
MNVKNVQCDRWRAAGEPKVQGSKSLTTEAGRLCPGNFIFEMSDLKKAAGLGLYAYLRLFALICAYLRLFTRNAKKESVTKITIMDSLAPARSALAGLWLRPMELPLLPSVSHVRNRRFRDMQTIRCFPSGSSHKICNVKSLKPGKEYALFGMWLACNSMRAK